jgi:hypothetical protein
MGSGMTVQRPPFLHFGPSGYENECRGLPPRPEPDNPSDFHKYGALPQSGRRPQPLGTGLRRTEQTAIGAVHIGQRDLSASSRRSRPQRKEQA